MRTDVKNQNGEKVGTLELSKEVFEVKPDPTLIHQAAVAQMSNARPVIAHTKGRGVVRGGGRKPWRQKGTGRARHGSRRSPIWVGGGITFGPTKYRNFKKKINAKMKRKALLMVLSGKAADKEIVVLDKIELASAKTREMAAVVDRVVPDTKSALLILPAKNEAIARAGRNIADFRVIGISNINVLDLLNNKYLILLKDTAEALAKKYGTV